MNPAMALHPPPRPFGQRGTPWTPRDAAFVADWRPTLFVHYRVPAELLGREVTAPLDLYAGHAYVTLVFFRLEAMRRAGWGRLGGWLCRPISGHPFFNLRTYVCGAAGPGIQFLAEWIPNRLSLAIGPRAYGLPYRFGRFGGDGLGPDGTGRLRVDDPELMAGLELAFSPGATDWLPARPALSRNSCSSATWPTPSARGLAGIFGSVTNRGK